jgi:hypothetical protein
MTNIASIATQLEAIYTNPDSYVQKTVHKNKTDDNDMKQKLLTILSQVDKIDDELVSVIKSTLNVLFTDANIKVSYDNLKDYLIFMHSRTGKTNCVNFVSQFHLAENFGDDDVIPVEVLFKAQTCESCGFFNEAHTACTKYTVDNPKTFDSQDCECCGLSQYSHIVCDTFTGTNGKMCDSCGRDLFTHQEHAKNHGHFNCTHFQKTDDSSIFDCKNCIFPETDHYLNPNLLKMNKKAYSKFTELACEFQIQFISQGPYIMAQNIDDFTKVIKMNYTSLHPLFSFKCRIDS